MVFFSDIHMEWKLINVTIKNHYFNGLFFNKMLKMKHSITIITNLGEKMRSKYFFKSFKLSLILVVFLMIFLSLAGVTCNAQGIADTYAPIFYFEGEETCYPVDASYHIENSYLYSSNGQLISNNPSGLNLSSYSSSDLYDSYYLDNILGSIDDDKIIKEYQKNENSLGFTVYYHEYYDIATSSTVIQYWMFFIFNKGHLNRHEGDWEMVQVVIPDFGDKWIGYSQHYSGQRARWEQVEKDGNHIKVYVARGSHANFFRSYSGKFGIANDFVGNNGKILRPKDYNLISLDGQSWLNFAGRWGELGGNVIESTAKSVLGQAGPRGPKYRLDGQMWENPISWGQSLLEVNDTMFLLEWFIYNFIMIFVLITIILLIISFFLIYRRHKKYGLGPRFISIFYIDGINIKSIGNIVCIVAIILIILGLVYPWYQISYDTSALEISEEFKTAGMTELMKIDGIGGIQIVIPGQNGFSPLGTISIPFSILFVISLIFLFIASIGIVNSKKLGSKYIYRGIRFFIPIILILIAIMALGYIIPSNIAGNNEASESITTILKTISNSPFGNEQTFNIDIGEGLYAPLKTSWGLGIGAWLLLMGGIIMIAAGIFEKIANVQFFTPKVPLKNKLSMGMQIPLPQQTQEPSKKTKTSKKEKGKTKGAFCTECGEKLEENATFCVKCGKKVE